MLVGEPVAADQEQLQDGSLIGRGSGEPFQLAFHGPGFVVIQPSEGQPEVTSSRAEATMEQAAPIAVRSASLKPT